GNGKSKRDDREGRQYFYVNGRMESSDKEFNMVDVELGGNEDRVFNGLDEDDVCGIRIDREMRELSVDT
ncbi:hypothetical protein, partial [Staphylococcus hominis]|uniref:hypothetical protein n=1 Tax=Staphylococcus hominis TaxID=1290 RepID=UPI0016429DB8